MRGHATDTATANSQSWSARDPATHLAARAAAAHRGPRGRCNFGWAEVDGWG